MEVMRGASFEITQVEKFQNEIEWLIAFADPVQGGCSDTATQDMDDNQLRALITFLAEGIRHVGKLYEVAKG